MMIVLSLISNVNVCRGQSAKYHYFKSPSGGRIVCAIDNEQKKTVSIVSMVRSRYVEGYWLYSHTIIQGVSGDIEIPSQVELWLFDALYNIDKKVGLYTIERLSSEAFVNCEKLRSITLPSTIKRIDEKAFYNCQNLVSVNLPSTMEYIKPESFYNCPSLKSVNVEDGLNTHYSSFDGILCEGGSVVFCPFSFQGIVNIPASISEIKENVFKNHEGVTDVVIQNGTKTIGSSAFEGCISLQKVKLPASVKSLGDNVFKGCTLLKDIQINEGLDRIGSSTFADCLSLQTIYLPGSLQYIGPSTFSNCINLELVRFSEGNRYIMDEAFSFCSSLKELILPSTIELIGTKAFMGCENLGKVALPEKIREIGRYAFFGCATLTSINVPGHTKVYDETFLECNNLQ